MRSGFNFIQHRARSCYLIKLLKISIFQINSDRNVFFERCTLTPFQKIMLKIKMVLCCKTKPENLLFFKGKFLVVEKAPEPNDILWENLHYSTKYKVKVRGGIYSVAFIFLMICFGIILGISFGQVYFFFNFIKNVAF